MAKPTEHDPRGNGSCDNSKGLSNHAKILAKQRRQKAFLEAYKIGGTIVSGCKAAKVSRRVVLNWRTREPEFAQRFLEAHEEASEALETEARRRAKDGWDEPVFYEGEIVGSKRKYSDTLLIFLMKGNLPEKYKERFEHSGDVDHPVSVELDLTKLSDEELQSLEDIVDKMGNEDG